MVDLAQGESHIVVRHGATEYYHPGLFHISSTFEHTVPVFISDIVHSRNLSAIYGPSVCRDIVMINNHPIKTVRVFGRVISKREIFAFDNTTKDLLFMLELDDCSGIDLKITIKVRAAGLAYPRLDYNSVDDKILEVVGTTLMYKNQHEITAQALRCLENTTKTTYLDLEITQWKERLDYRDRVLKRPWVVQPIRGTSPGLIVTRFDYRDQKRREAKENLKFNIHEVPQLARDDSLILFRTEGNLSRMSHEVHDVASDSDVEIVHVKEVPLQIVTQFQISIEFIKWIIRHDFQTFQLSHIYGDPHISNLLEILVKSYRAFADIGASDPIYTKLFHEQKEILFHRIRHGLTTAKLISITRSQRVRSKNLNALYGHLKQCCEVIKNSMLRDRETKILDVSNYLATVKSRGLVSGDIDLKYINAIVDYITTDVWHERAHWKYDLKLTQWSYSQTSVAKELVIL
ncbi:uncharacterized protein CANTADRAFT_5117 [Suhomyces tanzawaensis NRRL Y-17324]|uniref:CST complex subunit Stn1 N-terminal domain-containing protein n=1 Tax=Suhomyces tanzawaensis NRRL Y-17324 TaxID=984487 RepID=A0A1E4SNQ6_9ASCO|nr:uncharacterized protein CANTADRAFT_5117 [Suhomyces tanzawaensis NRRL Y-17324]ODV81151.1 hypothetical protein CANTADRAFT_5117 [Suhomyces tanzawaensis NRRL Y-17324]